MECTDCKNESRLKACEEKNKEIELELKVHDKQFVDLQIANAVREARDKSIDQSLMSINSMLSALSVTVAEIKATPVQKTVKRVDRIMDRLTDKGVDYIVIAVLGYILYVVLK